MEPPITSEAQAVLFMHRRDIDLRVSEAVLRAVVTTVLAGEKTYHLWSNGSDGRSTCARGTVTRIRRLLESGRLDPYVAYLNQSEERHADGVRTSPPRADHELRRHRRELFDLAMAVRNEESPWSPRAVVDPNQTTHAASPLLDALRQHLPPERRDELAAWDSGITHYEEVCAIAFAATSHGLLDTFESTFDINELKLLAIELFTEVEAVARAVPTRGLIPTEVAGEFDGGARRGVQVGSVMVRALDARSDLALLARTWTTLLNELPLTLPFQNLSQAFDEALQRSKQLQSAWKPDALLRKHIFEGACGLCPSP